MPINPEFAHLYRGKKWRDRRAEILRRDRNRCKKCGAKNGRQIQRQIVRSMEGKAIAMWWRYMNRGKGQDGGGWRNEQGARDTPKPHTKGFTLKTSIVEVQLGVAHLDHDPSNDSDSNLAALCRRCHIVHDADQHAQNAAITRSDRKDRERPLLRMIEDK